MTDRALSFGVAAEAYALARPTYPVDAVRFCLPPAAHSVLDLGAGTGKLTSVLLDLGLDVTAVEPDDAMRSLVDPRATVLAGTAEAVPLPAASVDAVLVGQAWHWFTQPDALRECLRVLRPGGTLGLLWNLLDDSDGWPRDVAQLVGMEDVLSQESGEEPEGPAGWARILVAHEQPVDADTVVAQLTSKSLVILLPQDERLELLGRARALLPDGEFPMPWVCNAWVLEKP